MMCRGVATQSLADGLGRGSVSAHLQRMKHLARSASNLATTGCQDGHCEGRRQQLRMLSKQCSQALRVRVPPAALLRR